MAAGAGLRERKCCSSVVGCFLINVHVSGENELNGPAATISTKLIYSNETKIFMRQLRVFSDVERIISSSSY